MYSSPERDLNRRLLGLSNSSSPRFPSSRSTFVPNFSIFCLFTSNLKSRSIHAQIIYGFISNVLSIHNCTLIGYIRIKEYTSFLLPMLSSPYQYANIKHTKSTHLAFYFQMPAIIHHSAVKCLIKNNVIFFLFLLQKIIIIQCACTGFCVAIQWDQSEVGNIDCEIQPEKGMHFFLFSIVLRIFQLL